MKLSKAEVRGKATLGMELRFETQNLTSYSGLILFQHFFSLIGIKERLWRCFRHVTVNPIYSHHVMVMLLVVHLIIGHRRLRDLDYYRDDELVKRVLGLKRLPDVSTVSRSLSSADERSVGNVRAESTTMVIERLAAEGLASVTLDFDGSVLSTGRHAEGTAVGFNKKKKGARSYYPLFCTVAQTDQVLDVHHRPGNVHDSNGADAFIERCVRATNGVKLHEIHRYEVVAFREFVLAVRIWGWRLSFWLWPASAPGSPPSSPCGTPAPSSTADVARYAGRGGTVARSLGTCVVFASSSAGTLPPPMMDTSMPHRDVATRRAEENEEKVTGSFSKKTPPKKTPVSDRWNHYTFRSVLAVRTVREALPRIKIEVRIDSAFFNQGIVERLHSLGVTFSISVPFERFAELKATVERRRRWRPMAGELGYFESRWKPKSWNTRYRFIFVRKRVRRQNKAPVQLDLFEPVEYGCEFKVIVTNKRISPRKVVLFHDGRGSQEGIFAELKTHCQMGYVPVKTRVGNQLYMFAGILAHNLTRELQMRLNPRERRTTAKRAALWCFREIETLRRTLIQRAGRIIRPAGKLILSMNSNARLEDDLRHALTILNASA